ncbi:alpha/beta fold hydrolase [Streptomyces sp. NPDC001450]
MPGPVQTDYPVAHTSNNPANPNKQVNLFVREWNGTQPGHDPEPVLMLHGRSVPVLAGYDLVIPGVPGDDAIRYSWAQQLAKEHYDVYMMDVQGNGKSPRLMMDDPCNANPSQRDDVLGSLAAPCGTPPYPHEFGTSQSEWAELATVVKFVRSRCMNKPIHFIGWSAAGPLMGPYALLHPTEVKSLFFLAPIFAPLGRWSEKPTDPFGLPKGVTNLPVSPPQAMFGFPMHVNSKTGFKIAWDRETGSPLQREPGIEDTVWAAMMDSDPVGAKWGPVLPDGTHEGVHRFRNSFWWGWNNETAKYNNVLGNQVPIALVHGELDRTANTPAALPVPAVLRFSVPDLYKAVPGPDKLMFQLAGAGHSMVWERPAKVLHQITKQWLAHQKVWGLTSGSYYRDPDGELTELE